MLEGVHVLEDPDPSILSKYFGKDITPHGKGVNICSDDDVIFSNKLMMVGQKPKRIMN